VDPPEDIDVLSQVKKIKIDANHEPGPTDQFIFERLEVFTEQTPTATSLQPADGRSQVPPDCFTPDFLIPPEMRKNATL
jgi:hypothetical protein